MMTPSDLTGRVAIVTGAAGDLGAATARCLAQAGADLCLVDADAGAMAMLAAELEDAGRGVLIHAADLADPAACSGVVAAAAARFGRLDALCNIATAFFPAAATSMTVQQWDRTLAVNLSAPFHLTRAALPHLMSANGAVVNVTSVVAHMAQPYAAAYAASKAGLEHLTRALAAEYVHHPVRINSVAPGGLMAAASAARMPDDVDVTSFPRLSPSRRRVDPACVADAIVFLVSDGARDYHGACITIDGGLSLGRAGDPPA